MQVFKTSHLNAAMCLYVRELCLSVILPASISLFLSPTIVGALGIKHNLWISLETKASNIDIGIIVQYFEGIIPLTTSQITPHPIFP